jgi:uncharacterized protein YigE (DUF2233 family)
MIAWLPLAVASSLLWQAVAPGVWQASAPMARKGPLAPVRATVLKLDPAQVRFELQRVTREHGLRGAWTVDSLPANGLAAWNAGQFTGPAPWGWLVRDGREEQPPASAPLGMAFVVDREGRVSLVPTRDLARRRTAAQLAFQSYPALLVDGAMPWALKANGRGVRLERRDSRVAIGTLPDGHVLVAITRFTGLGEAGAELPWGPTVPEMAAWMRTQGCRDAMMLDGGLSSQMAVRGRDGTVSRWPNLRAVPLGMVVLPRAAHVAAKAGPAAAGPRQP